MVLFKQHLLLKYEVMICRVFFVFTYCLIAFSSISQQTENAILGKWISSEKNLVVEVYKQGIDYKAKVIWFYDVKDMLTPLDQCYDKRNPDTSLRKQKLLGLDVLKHLTYKGKEKKWADGKIYDSTSGGLWEATV